MPYNLLMQGKTKVITCGCRFNRYESEEIRQRTGDSGTKPLVIINSCAVTEKSEAKSRYAVRKAIRENPDASIVVSGCWAELDPEAVGKIEGVDLVLGNEEKLSINKYLKGGSSVHVGEVNSSTSFVETEVGRLESRTAAYLKIQNGCDDSCSFCVVRLARGKNRSASLGFIKKRVAEFASLGVREIVFTGINVGQYGKEFAEDISLATVLSDVAVSHKDIRFRLSSINPNEITKELVDVMAKYPNICRYLHIPMQAGSDNILKAMRRPYTADEYRGKIKDIESKLPGIAIGCDIMAGFPGETEEDFNRSLKMLEELPLIYAHVFRYSSRPQTDAHNLDGAIDEAVKKVRVEKLKSAVAAKNLEFRKNMLGTVVEVLVEANGDNSDCLKGKTGTHINVEFKSNNVEQGELVKVRIEKVIDNGVYGILM